ncbi:hypothetical protein CD943_10945 [Brevundimonas diminuta]|uniref:Glycosyl transferase family 1 domain-containing protein n=2 Tax=Brevundimonas diminuta TaxID=293 RepID=A0A1Z3LYZ3_BREDI|nr:hypothetical protein CD943_10945 [Brevundimonas diminuta]
MIMTLYFDLTTTLCWGGPPVGITRVEREIAKRAHGRTHAKIAYCFYQATSGSFYEMAPWLAEAVLSGACHLNRDDLLAADFARRTDRTEISKIVQQTAERSHPDARALALAHANVTNLTLEDILKARDSLSVIPVYWGDDRRPTPSFELVTKKIKPTSDTWIINGGLDWEHKDIRSIRIAKDKNPFKYVAIIYDIIPLLYPHYVVPSYVDVLKRYFGELLWTADYALCISDTTMNDVQTHMNEWRMPELEMDSWPLGCDILPETAHETSLSPRLTGSKYLLYVSTIEPRKSHRTIVDAFDHLIRSDQLSEDALCVFVGRTGWNIDNLLQEIRTNPSLRDRIITLSDVSDDDLVALYQGARFVVFPSRYEGYGLSLVEAMGLGKACLSSNTGSLREVGGDAPLYIPPHDVAAWSEAIRDFMNNDDIVSEYEERSINRYKPITWDRSADLFYERLNAKMAKQK